MTPWKKCENYQWTCALWVHHIIFLWKTLNGSVYCNVVSNHNRIPVGSIHVLAGISQTNFETCWAPFNESNLSVLFNQLPCTWCLLGNSSRKTKRDQPHKLGQTLVSYKEMAVKFFLGFCNGFFCSNGKEGLGVTQKKKNRMTFYHGESEDSRKGFKNQWNPKENCILVRGCALAKSLRLHFGNKKKKPQRANFDIQYLIFQFENFIY